MTLYRTNIFNDNIEEIDVESFDDTHYWRQYDWIGMCKFPRKRNGATYHATREEAVKCVRERLVEDARKALLVLEAARGKLADFDRQHPRAGCES